MAHNPSMRASDVEREHAAAALREHYAQGRLTRDEFDERLEAAYTAKTVGELERLTADLPAEDLHELPVPAYQQGSQPARRQEALVDLPGGPWPWLWGSWAAVSALGCALWLLLIVLPAPFAGFPWEYPWWLWVSGPWGVIQLMLHVQARRRRWGP